MFVRLTIYKLSDAWAKCYGVTFDYNDNAARDDEVHILTPLLSPVVYYDSTGKEF